ncbi:glycosyl-4,4'-diaponeurosporenoate acyltransferase [Mammaliicoccus sciuri]|uniref:glycosyl-4,4'-diaponeurosporenoate acyltransferase CrtO family protein n=2 Tax=Mammaliicoccus sciuri TaxID=1296 RepID=UPI002FBEE110
MFKLIRTFIYIALYWFITQMFIVQIGLRIRDKWLVRDFRYFKSGSLEQNGQLWQKLVKVKCWKDHLPDGQMIQSDIVSKSHYNQSSDITNIEKFVIETKRAELVHLLSILPIVVFIKSKKSIKVINIVYVVIANVPCIIVQRYNRPKLQRIYLKKLIRKGD